MPVMLVGPGALPPQGGGAPNRADCGSPISLHTAFHGTHSPSVTRHIAVVSTPEEKLWHFSSDILFIIQCASISGMF